MNSRESEQHSQMDSKCERRIEAFGGDSMDHQYGRRIERDGSWSIYHVFTGIPAKIQGCCLTGLSRVRATEGMLSLNRRNEARRHEHCRPLSSRVFGQEGRACLS